MNSVSHRQILDLFLQNIKKMQTLFSEEEGGRNDVLGNVDNLEADEVYNKNGGT